ncbi:GTPase activating-like protein [Heterobasidion irregulare TC 32-1]|uniref:GTPase activating-like protein n=1 Tax=Heterobasidion irregulare (strain TC 32-1) TaxID=747525 RepID=W4KE65_HETIT|nr:GTPase activating-like protein [Heterobasidion irregulare TC 32-1]ETW83336.1 GTPase activating-like protein [Heterobasidion irregulare TC 32-1]
MGQRAEHALLDTPEVEEHAVFGKPLKESLRYASVQISTANANGELYVWGYIPVVVAKCGLYLKENATEVEGTFRVNGSNKRMRDLQAMFEARPRYGKSLDWKKENYTTHDVASVFRRYLTQMPEPVIPYDLYFQVRATKQPYIQDDVIATYKRLISSMPRANQYLLLYVLDLLSVFARKCDKNLMTAKNLAVIFRPGIMSHPSHELSPKEHQLSQEVLEFLIAHQDWFMLDIPPPPAKAKTSAAGEEMDDMALVSSSDDDRSTVGGWKLVGGRSEAEKRKIARRRTTTERERERLRIGEDSLLTR